MPSNRHKLDHLAFGPMLSLVFLLWIAYRFLFHFPTWFDEIFGKAIFFGLPVWLYLSFSKLESIKNSFELSRFRSGVIQGVLLGSIYGFVAILTLFIKKGFTVEVAPLFSSDLFWWQFYLSLMTGFWESLFFFSFVMTIVQAKYTKLTLLKQVLVVVLVFVVFHLPSVFLRYSVPSLAGQVLLLAVFAAGQAAIFAKTHNVYTLAISHAFWGMVLLTYSIAYGG